MTSKIYRIRRTEMDKIHPPKRIQRLRSMTKTINRNIKKRNRKNFTSWNKQQHQQQLRLQNLWGGQPSQEQNQFLSDQFWSDQSFEENSYTDQSFQNQEGFWADQSFQGNSIDQSFKQDGFCNNQPLQENSFINRSFQNQEEFWTDPPLQDNSCINQSFQNREEFWMDPPLQDNSCKSQSFQNQEEFWTDSSLQENSFTEQQRHEEFWNEQVPQQQQQQLIFPCFYFTEDTTMMTTQQEKEDTSMQHSPLDNMDNNCSLLNPFTLTNSLFYYCRSVLEQYLSQYKNVTVAAMDRRRGEMKREYAGPSRVSYWDQVTQAAYVKFDVALHASSIAHLIATYPFLSQIFNQQVVTVVSMGCGPGSDMLGILHYLFQSGQRPLVRFLLCDAMAGWKEAIDSFEKFVRINHPFPFGPHFEKTFWPTNLAQGPLLYLPAYSNCDIIIFSMIISEIAKGVNEEEIENTRANLIRLCRTAKQGALFLIIDINTPWLNEIVNLLEQTIFVNFTQLVFKIGGDFTIQYFNKQYCNQYNYCQGSNWKPKGKSNLLARMYIKV